MNRFIATMGYIGYFPLFPGTFASAITALLIFNINLSISQYVLLWLLMFIIGLYTSHFMVSESKDPSEIVIDEFLGMSLSLLYAPKSFMYYLGVFLVFRFLDITKPFLIDKIQDFSGGFGIIMDDVLAGFITLILARGIYLIYA